MSIFVLLFNQIIQEQIKKSLKQNLLFFFFPMENFKNLIYSFWSR